MDRKTLIGLVLIVLVLVAFSFFNKQGEPDKKNTGKGNDTTQTDQITEQTENEIPGHLIAQLDDNGQPIVDSVKGTLYLDTLSGKDTFLLINVPEVTELTQPETNQHNANDSSAAFREETFTLETDKLIVNFSNKGGRVTSVFIKDYRSYEDYMADSDAPLQLFDEKSTYGLLYPENGAVVRTDELEFRVKEQTENSITLETARNGKKIGFTYKTKPGVYDVDYNVYFKGFTDQEVAATAFTADFYMLSTEKYFTGEETQATLYWQYVEDNYDYIQRSEDEILEEKTEWVAFRTTYFSTIISSKNGFGVKDSKVGLYQIADESQTKYVKKYTADMNLGATSAGNTVEMNWYFGPVDYDVLVEYDNGTEDIVELGTGLFRWINKYALRPLFMLLINSGMGMALAILLLTIIVKLVLSPINYKMYLSSAKMKVLKPEIEKISKKYPKKEDAMKKQQETMAMYREAGVNPLSGCVPMLIQMPILFAIFRLFPAAIELRQTSFLWAEDLSTFDSPISFGFNIPLYGDHVSILTLLMAGTTLIYTHYNSSNMQQPTQEGMPNMKFIMYLFPIMMIFFFNNYASGLSYYYFISTLMTIVIMWAIKRFMIDDEKILAKIEATRSSTKKKGKSRFQQRLEEAQKLQQEKAKQRKGK